MQDLIKSQLNILTGSTVKEENNTLKCHVKSIDKQLTYSLGRLATEVEDINFKRSGTGITIIVKTINYENQRRF